MNHGEACVDDNQPGQAGTHGPFERGAGGSGHGQRNLAHQPV
jgi:hypothetical protein